METTVETPGSAFEDVLTALPALYQVDLPSLLKVPLDAERLADRMRVLASAGQLRLTSLNLTNNRIGDDGVQHIAHAVASSSGVRLLDLGWNRIGPAGLDFVAKMLESPACLLSSLDLECNDLGDTGATILAGALPKNKILKTLRIGGNRIASSGAEALAAMLPMSLLEILDIGRNYLGPRGAKSFAKSLGGASSTCGLHTLRLEVNRIRDEGAKALAEAMCESANGKSCLCQIDSLDLGSNQITDDGAMALSRAFLIKPLQLRWLGLGHNKLTTVGGLALAELVETGNNDMLQAIDLVGNDIGDDIPVRIAQALRCNSRAIELFNPVDAMTSMCAAGAYRVEFKGLRMNAQHVERLATALRSPLARVSELLLGSTLLGDAGVCCLLSIMQARPGRVIDLDLGWNSISCIGAKHVADLLLSSGGNKLQKLDLECNDLRDKGVHLLASALGGSGQDRENNCGALQVLLLSANGIGQNGACDLAGALRQSHVKIIEVDLGRNRVGASGAQALATVLGEPSSSLLKLDLSVNRLGDSGAKAVANALLSTRGGLVDDCKEICINLNSNLIGDDGAVALSEVVASHESLAALSLEYNKITGCGTQQLQESMETRVTAMLGHTSLSCKWNEAAIDVDKPGQTKPDSVLDYSLTPVKQRRLSGCF